MIDFEETQRKEFNTFWKNNSGVLDESNASLAEFESLISFIGGKKKVRYKKILDFGCGSGRFALRFAKYFDCDVTGIDISKEGIETSNAVAIKNGIKNYNGLISNKINYEGYFDFVLMVNLLHHTSNQENILNECVTSLNKGGKLIIFENNPINPLFVPFFFIIKQFRSHFNLEYLKSNRFMLCKCIEQCGFKILKFERYAFFPTMLYNYSSHFKKINELINRIPLINEFCAFHLILAEKKD